MIKVFLKDMLDRKTIKNYILLCLFFFMGVDYLLEKNPDLLKVNLNIRWIIFLFLALFTTTYFFIKSYGSSDGNLFYYALPYGRKKINGSFFLALLADTGLRKLSLIFIYFYLLKVGLAYYGYMLLSGVLACGLSLILNSTNISKQKKFFLAFLGLLILANLYLLKDFFAFKTMALVIYCVEVLAYILILYSSSFEKLIIKSKNDALTGRLPISNYFLKFILSEKIYLINSFAILCMILFLSLFMPKPMNLPLSFAVATINSPLLSIFSTEKGLKEYDTMLPSKYRSLSRQYLHLLIGYFLMVHLFILGINYREFGLPLLLVALVLSGVDIIGSYMLEKKWTIKEKKTDMAMWKSPRKYILSVVAFCVSFIGLVLL